MPRPLFGCLIGLIIGFGLFPKANAATLVLQSGQKIEGQIIEQTELRVIVDVHGLPQTYYLAEIASIDGKKVEMPQEQAVDMALAQENTPSVPPPAIEEQKSLANFMNKRDSETSSINNSIDHKASAPLASPKINPTSPQDSEKLEDLVHGMRDMMGKMADVNKNVVSTPDGGIIVVSPEKIIKYDKNLNVIKEINLNPDNPAGSK